MFSFKGVTGRNIYKLRRKRNWTRCQLAARVRILGCFMTAKIVSDIEQLKVHATDKQIVFVAEALGVELDELFIFNKQIWNVVLD